MLSNAGHTTGRRLLAVLEPRSSSASVRHPATHDVVPAGLQKLIRNKTHSATGLDFGLRFQHSGAFLHITLVDVLVECSRA
jgi:hypothetical protein